jgi:xylulokinase
MSDNLIIGLDIGTTTSKITIFDIETKENKSILKEHKLDMPNPGWLEIDPNEIWNNVLSGIRECFYNSKFKPEYVKAISYSVLGCSITPISKKGQILYPFIEGWDSRENGYKKYFDYIISKIGEKKLFDITGNFLVYGSISKILWLRDNRKDIFDRTWKFLCAGDFITYKLTGIPVIDFSMASIAMNFDIKDKKYSYEILDNLMLNKKLFPDVCQAGSVVGEITKEISDFTGLNKSTKVVAGSHDQTCSALGVGNIDEGIISDGLGTVECMGITLKKPKTNLQMMKNMIPCYPHALKDKYFSFGAQLSFGLILKWFRDTLCLEEVQEAKKNDLSAYALIDRNAIKSPPGAKGILILPHLRGSGSGVFPAYNLGSKCSIIGLSIFHNKSDISRAVLESVCYESRLIKESLQKTGLEFKEARTTGGCSKSDIWLQIKSDITNLKIVVPKFKDSGLMGAIILASLGIGLFKSEQDAVKELIEIEKEIFPGGEETIYQYDKCFKIYKQLYTKLNPLYENIKSL